jgi:hypothetical protein
MKEAIYDAAIVGAGPAGSTAAVLLARKGRNIVLIDREKTGRAVPCAGWLSAKAKGVLDEIGCTFPGDCVTPFSHATFYNADCTRHATPQLQGPVGYLIDRRRFDAALIQHAVSLGADLRQGEEVRDVQLHEAQVSIKLSASAIQSRLLVLATGRTQHLASRVGFSARGSDAPTWVAQVDAPNETTESEACAAVILGLDGRGSFGFCGHTKDRCTLSANLVGEATLVVPTLVQLCKVAAAKGLMARDLSALAAQTRPIRCPAGWALDMDTHVAKHTLLVGGGEQRGDLSSHVVGEDCRRGYRQGIGQSFFAG